MPHPIEIVVGNIFSRSTDLLVLPSARSGTLGDGIAKGIREHDIPPPPPYQELGGTTFVNLGRDNRVASVVCWAASVARTGSSVDAIRSIAKVIADYVRNRPTIKTVSTPLLGAGAGGLTPTQSAEALSEGFKVDRNDCVLRLHVVDPGIAADLGGNTDQRSAALSLNDDKPPSTFITYTHETEEHANWVLRVATDLTSSFGVQVLLDQWDLVPGGSLTEFMERAVRESEFVVAVCTEIFAEKADARRGGVGYEHAMISALVLEGLQPERLIPILRAHSATAAIPTYLKGKKYIDFSTPERYQESLEALARAIHRRPLKERPKLGRRPF